MFEQRRVIAPDGGKLSLHNLVNKGLVESGGGRTFSIMDSRAIASEHLETIFLIELAAAWSDQRL